MPAAIVWLLGGLATLLTQMVPRILFALGIGFATYTGVTTGFDSLKASIITNMQGLPATITGVLGILRLDQGVTLILSTYAAVIATKAVAGAVTKLHLKGTA